MDNEEKKYFRDIKMALRKLSEIGVPVTPIIKAVMNAESELAEIEDERIREELINHCRQGSKQRTIVSHKEDYKRWLAWLEKQKEQKPVQSEEEKEYVRTLKGLVSDFIRDSGGGITDVEYYQNICDWLDGRHIEQKPAEWDDYTKTNLGRAIQIIKDARGTLHGYQTDDGIYECDKAIEALEHFLYRGLEIEKSAEWSEEDEEMLNSCICSIEESKENRYAYKETDGDTSYDHEIAWLKSLPERFNLQSKQEQNDYITPHKEFFKFIYDRLINVHKENPNVDYMRSFKERLNNLSFGEKQEWSEEDEKMLKWIEDILLIADDDLNDKLNGKVSQITDSAYSSIKICIAKCFSWLKSLRPSWKPSEAQLMALHSVIDDESDTIGNEQLKLLYNDLKKL